MSISRFIVKHVIAGLGIEIRRAPPDPMSEFGVVPQDPITYQYFARLPSPGVLNVQLSHARAGVMGFPCTDAVNHPLVAASCIARSALNPQRAFTEVSGYLQRFYDTVRPASALDVLDVRADDARGLVGVERDSWVFPWMERGIAASGRLRQTLLSEEGLQYASRLSGRDGMTLYGPASPKKLALEAKRVTKLVTSIREKGYQARSGHLPEVVGLRTGSDYRWLVVQGQHRLAACAAFRITSLSVKVVSIVRREDAAYWPHVVNGSFTCGGALAIFDRLFAGKVPRCAATRLTHLEPAGQLR